MDLSKAYKLTRDLVRRATNGTIEARVEEYDGVQPSIVFSGGAYGPASLDVGVSTPERVRAHFEGYVEANGLSVKPRVGQKVAFGSATTTMGVRTGKVRRLESKRAIVSYLSKASDKRSRSWNVPYEELVFGEIQPRRAAYYTETRRSR